MIICIYMWNKLLAISRNSKIVKSPEALFMAENKLNFLHSVKRFQVLQLRKINRALILNVICFNNPQQNCVAFIYNYNQEIALKEYLLKLRVFYLLKFSKRTQKAKICILLHNLRKWSGKYLQLCSFKKYYSAIKKNFTKCSIKF